MQYVCHQWPEGSRPSTFIVLTRELSTLPWKIFNQGLSEEESEVIMGWLDGIGAEVPEDGAKADEVARLTGPSSTVRGPYENDPWKAFR